VVVVTDTDPVAVVVDELFSPPQPVEIAALKRKTVKPSVGSGVRIAGLVLLPPRPRNKGFAGTL
jgi:hypothetical protein